MFCMPQVLTRFVLVARHSYRRSHRTVLAMKEAITETRPLVLDALLKIPANFYVVTEWTPLPADKARKEVNKRRRHFNRSKPGFVSQMGNDATKTNPRDVWWTSPTVNMSASSLAVNADAFVLFGRPAIPVLS